MEYKENPSVSIVIELDNAAFRENSEWMMSINALLHWVEKSEEVNVIEVFITHNKDYMNLVSSYLENISDSIGLHVKSLALEKEDAHYYMMKNAGANKAAGKIVVFFDCDLKPIQGSFDELIRPLYEKGQVASCGGTCFPLNDFLSKSYSLFWFFPIWQQMDSVDKYQLLVSNVAFRAEWFLQTGFDMKSGGFKVCCYLLAQRLKAEGRVLHHPDVWFEHEVWNSSLKFFIWRAVVAGRDHDKKVLTIHSRNRLWRLRAAVKSWLLDIKRLYRRSVQYNGLVKFNFIQAISSILLGICFFTLLRSSQFKAALSPENNQRETVPKGFVS